MIFGMLSEPRRGTDALRSESKSSPNLTPVGGFNGSTGVCSRRTPSTQPARAARPSRFLFRRIRPVYTEHSPSNVCSADTTSRSVSAVNFTEKLSSGRSATKAIASRIMKGRARSSTWIIAPGCSTHCRDQPVVPCSATTWNVSPTCLVSSLLHLNRHQTHSVTVPATAVHSQALRSRSAPLSRSFSSCQWGGRAHSERRVRVRSSCSWNMSLWPTSGWTHTTSVSAVVSAM